MRPVLKIALAFFAIAPVQTWINLVGILLLAIAGGIFLLGDNTNSALIVLVLCWTAAGLMLAIPAMAGGIALRYASAAGKLHLRPHGRVRVLLGATLALTAMAALVTLPVLADRTFRAVHGLTMDPRALPLPGTFEVAWSAAALVWMAMFWVSRTPLAPLVFALVPVSGVKLEDLLQRWVPGLTAHHVFIAGLLAWGAFAVWFLTARTILRPVNLQAFSWKSQGEITPFHFLLKGDSAPATQDPRTTATFHYLLGAASLRLFVFNGLLVAAFFGLMNLLSPSRRAPGPGQALFMLPFLGMFGALIGYTAARRARFLWLRAGMDRGALFSLASRYGLKASFTTWGIVAAPLSLFAMISNPAQAPSLLLFFVAQAVTVTGLFFGCLSMVRNWSVGQVLLTIGLGVLFILQVSIFGPHQTGNTVMPWTLLLVLSGVCAPALYAHARRQWRGIDWQEVKPAKLDWRG